MELASLLRQTLEIGIKEEMIELKAVVVDGIPRTSSKIGGAEY